MNVDLEKLKEENAIVDEPLFVCYRGSFSHGLYREGSIDDVDLLSVYAAPESHYLGFGRNKHEKGRDRWFDKYDVVNYELSHYTKLLFGMNPNVLPSLHVPKDFVLKQSGPVMLYRVKKELFYDSREIYKSYKGYAHGQFEKLKKDVKNIDEIKKLEKLNKKKENEGLSEEERKLKEELSEKYLSGWMGRKRKRNVIKYGYDPKWATHCVRLLKNGMELLETKEMNVNREGIDKEFLMSIKNGEFELEEICETIEGYFKEFDEVYDDVEKEEIDRDAVENLLIRNVKTYVTSEDIMVSATP